MAKKMKQIRTPEGTFVYPYLTRPDSYKGVEKYKAKIRLPLDGGGQELIDTIDKLLATEVQKDTLANGDEPVTYNEKKDFPYLPYTVDDIGGFVEVVASLKARGGRPGNQWDQKVDVFDSQMNVIPSDVDILSGSKGSFIGQPFRWGDPDEGAIGISIRLMAARVTEIVDEIVRDAESYGYEAVAGGVDVTKPVATEAGDASFTEGEDY